MLADLLNKSIFDDTARVRRVSPKLLPEPRGPVSSSFPRRRSQSPLPAPGRGGERPVSREDTHGGRERDGTLGGGRPDGRTDGRPPQRAGGGGGVRGEDRAGSFPPTVGGTVPAAGGRPGRQPPGAALPAPRIGSRRLHLGRCPGQHYAHLAVPDRHIYLHEPAQPSGHHLPGHGQRHGGDLHEAPCPGPRQRRRHVHAGHFRRAALQPSRSDGKKTTQRL